MPGGGSLLQNELATVSVIKEATIYQWPEDDFTLQWADMSHVAQESSFFMFPITLCITLYLPWNGSVSGEEREMVLTVVLFIALGILLSGL